MPMTHEHKYGLDFPKNFPAPMIELMCWKKYQFAPFTHGNLNHPGEHWLRAIRMLFTPAQLSISPWSEEFAMHFAVEDELMIWGCASCEKSHMAALGLVTFWITDPTETLCLFASQTREMLKLRSWSSVVDLFGKLKEHPQYAIPGKEARTSMAIINDYDSDSDSGASSKSVKASIRGVAVTDSGSSLRGCHTRWAAICYDEINLMRPDVYDERLNIQLGAVKCKVLSLCNPSSFNDLAGRIAEPEAGWSSVDHNTESWRAKKGALVIHRSGYNSPAVKEEGGAEKYPYLISQKGIDAIIKSEGSADTPGCWSMIFGYPVPSGTEATVISEMEINTYEACAPVVWAAGQEPVAIAALDAAFTAPELGGDNCILLTARVGRGVPGIPTIVFDPPHYLVISASSKIPVARQIANQVRDILFDNNILLSRLAVDSSGTQSMADVIDMELSGPGGASCVRYNYASKATDALTYGGRETYADRYSDLATELWMLTASFIRTRNIRQLPAEAARQLSMRRVIRRTRNTKLSLESKREFSKRLAGASPDEGDAVAMACGIARDVLGFSPGQSPSQFTMPINSPVQLSQFPRRLQLKTSYGARAILKGYT